MEYSSDEYGYIIDAERKELGISSQITCEGNTLKINRAHEDSVINFTLQATGAESFTVDDGITVQTIEIPEHGYAFMYLHDDCIITLNGGTATAFTTEYIVDYPPLIPDNYNPEEKLHFNLWMQNNFEIG